MPEVEGSKMYKPVCEEQVRRVVTKHRIHVAWVIVPFLLLLSMQIGLAIWLATKSEIKQHITVVIDTNGTQRCGRSEAESRYPCMRNRMYVSSEDPIGPLRCRDDAFAQSGGSGPDSCHGNAFRIAGDGKGVVIPADGMYRVYAMVTFYDRIPHHTSMSLRIDAPSGECLGNHACLYDSDSRAHTWLTCLAHQPPAAFNGTGRDFVNCAIDGIRRFTAGETVGLQVAIGYREISGHYKATYMYIHKL